METIGLWISYSICFRKHDYEFSEIDLIDFERLKLNNVLLILFIIVRTSGLQVRSNVYL